MLAPEDRGSSHDREDSSQDSSTASRPTSSADDSHPIDVLDHSPRSLFEIVDQEWATPEQWLALRDFLLRIARQELGKDLSAKLDDSDVVQQSLMEASRDLEHFSGRTEAELKAWLRQVLRRNIADVGKHYRNASCREIARETETPQDTLAKFADQTQLTGSAAARRRESNQQMLTAIASLPEQKRRVIQMRHRDGLSYHEIARRLHSNEVAIRKVWSRAMEDLRGLLEHDPEPPRKPR